MANTRAVDVVLLPSEEMTEHCIGCNKALITLFEPKIVLSARDSVPHISLAMGCLEDQYMNVIQIALAKIAHTFPPLLLKTDTIAKSGDFCGFAVKNTPVLQHLHETVMDKISPFLTHSAEKDMFFDSSCIDEETPSWVNRFPESSRKKFFPHITLGFGLMRGSFKNPITFSAPALALCHLGNYCTCRRVLWLSALGPAEGIF